MPLVIIIFLTDSDAEALVILICIDVLYNSLQGTFARLYSAFTVLKEILTKRLYIGQKSEYSGFHWPIIHLLDSESTLSLLGVTKNAFFAICASNHLRNCLDQWSN